MPFLQCQVRQATTKCLRHSSQLSKNILPVITTTKDSFSSSQTRNFTTSSPSNRRDPGGTQRFGVPGRYQFRSPRYYRGPLHPNQPPPPSDPASRLFIPGPFTSERLWDHYNDTLRSDILALSYTHFPPGYKPRKYENRLRSWEGDDPYFANRPLRGPRGSSALPLVARPITFRNVPRLEAIVIHSFCKEAIQDSAAIGVAGIILQSMTGKRAEVVYSKSQIGEWGLSKDKPIGVKVRIEGPAMYRFLASCTEVIMPKIKEWPGVRRNGDGSGNISFGFEPDVVSLFPEVEVNYDMYPPKMVPGVHITCITTATNNKDGVLLLGSLGIPFTDIPKPKKTQKKLYRA